MVLPSGLPLCPVSFTAGQPLCPVSFASGLPLHLGLLHLRSAPLSCVLYFRSAPVSHVLHLQAAPPSCLLHNCLRQPHLSTPLHPASITSGFPLHLGLHIRAVPPSHFFHLTTVPSPQCCNLTTAPSILVLASRFPLHPISFASGLLLHAGCLRWSHTAPAPALHPRKSPLKQLQRDPNKT